MASKIILNEYIVASDKPQKTAIREAFEARLAQINTANGYWHDVTVYDFKKRNYNDDDIQYPYVHVTPADIDLKSAAPDSLQMQNSLTIVGVIKIAEEDDYLTQLEKLEEDVLRCLFPKKTGMQPGAFNTLNCELTNIYYDARESGDSEASINFTISYNTTIQTK